MWPSMRRWAGWAPKVWPFTRDAARLTSLFHGYDRAGLTVCGEPVPWTADCAWVTAWVDLPPGAPRRKDDFALHLPGQPPLLPASFRRWESPPDCHEVIFRFPPPGETVTTTITHRGRHFAKADVPCVGREEYLRSLRVIWAAPLVHLGMDTVKCVNFVGRQCRRLLVSFMLEAPTSLVPLLDEPVEVEFRCRRSGETVTLPACLSFDQMGMHQAVVTVVSPRRPRRPGKWSVTWRVGDHVLGQRGLRCLSLDAFHQSLQISDARFVVQGADGHPRQVTQAPPLTPGVRVGPCFLLQGRRHGTVGLCRVEVRGLLPKGERGPVLLEQEVLLPGGPALVTPGLVDAGELAAVTAFEVSVAGRVLGAIPLRPAPAATFTSEGAYQAPPEYAWGVAAEEEMTERLNRLIDGS